MRKFLLVAVLFMASSAFGQATFIQACTGNLGSGSGGLSSVTCVFATPIAANQLIVIGTEACVATCQAIGTAASVVSVTSSIGITYTNTLSQTWNGTRQFTNTMWYAFTGANSGAETITVTWSGPTGGGVVGLNYSGAFAVDGTPVQGTGAISGGGDPVFSDGSITTTRANSLLVVVADCNNCGSFQAGNPNVVAGWNPRNATIGEDMVLIDSLTNAATPGSYAGVAGAANNAASNWSIQFMAFTSLPGPNKPKRQVY